MHDDGYFTQEIAARYDDSTREMFSQDMVEPVVDFLLERSGGGRALEFGIGTGRIALPLARRGIEVSGVDVSRPMLDELARKPDGDTIDVVLGDFATTRAPGSYSIVYLVYNTIGNLTTQADQVECFRNAAAHLEPGGRFVIEVGIPELRRLPPEQENVVFRADESGWGIDEYDVANQGLISHHVDLVEGELRQFSIPFRYVWPSELDLMAEMAGMRLVERYAGWREEPFTSESGQHVSVWEKIRS